MAEDWSARQYLKFEDERTRPARDLLAQIPLTAPRRVVDIGCGPGNSTELLATRWPQAKITGLDTSPDMLSQARARLPAAEFTLADIATWTPTSDTDVLYANASLQWLPDPVAVMERLLQALPEGAALAVQMPDNVGEPSHRLMRETAADGPWTERLKGVARDPLPGIAAFYDRLKPHATRLDIWHTNYNHPLAGAPAIVEWFKSTALRPFLNPLPEDEREAFTAAYTARIAKAYPEQFDGKVLLRFPRLFIVAVR